MLKQAIAGVSRIANKLLPEDKDVPVQVENQPQEERRRKKVGTFTTTTRELLSKLRKLAPSVQRISGVSCEDPGTIPPVGRYSPSYATVDCKVKGYVLFKKSPSVHKTPLKQMQREHTEELKKKLEAKHSRSEYISSMIEKFNKLRHKTIDKEEPDISDISVLKKDSVFSINSEYSSKKYHSPRKININSKSVLRERKGSEGGLSKYQSLPQLASNVSTSPDSHPLGLNKQAKTLAGLVRRMKPLKFKSRKARVEEDIFHWAIKRALNTSAEEEFNPYNLKKALFDSAEKNPMTKSRCKSVIPFEKQTQRKPFRDIYETHENTYDGNPEVCKKSLATGVPDFKRYVKRPPLVKSIVSPDYCKPVEKIFRPYVQKCQLVDFKLLKPRDDLMYRQESVAAYYKPSAAQLLNATK